VGAELFNTHTARLEPLKAARIRGVVSEGMICSEKELGIGEDHAGIVVLPQDAPLGLPLTEYLGDHVLDLDVTPNRPDCLSILGVAREVAALTGGAVREPDCSYPEEGAPVESQVSVEIADPDLCPRYTASLVSGVRVGPSPRWLQDRLAKAGMRPINNIVDVTNYVMLEYNQPLHAFDFAMLKGGRIIVRRARPGETLLSLDGVERRLSPSMLVIADAEDAVALGGVIGGAHTEMTEGTTTVLLESANFNPANNRRTRQTLRLSTEASTRFEKGLRPELAPIALRRATQLIHQVAGGSVARGIVDVFPGRESHPAPVLTLTMKRLEKVLGLSIPVPRVEGALAALGFDCQRLPGVEMDGSAALRVTVPYWRSDVGLEDDLVEEVARLVGYDEIPTTMLSAPIPPSQPQPLQELRERIKDQLASCGLQEVITYPLTSLEELARVKALEGGAAPLKVANSLSREQEYLRPTLLASLLTALAVNRLHQQGPLRIFEAGRVFLPRQGDLPQERETVAGALSGPRCEPHWLSEGGELGFYDAKGVVEALMAALGVAATYQAARDPLLHPARGARITAGETPLGRIGELHPSVADSFGLEDSTVAFFELDVESLLSVVPPGGRRHSVAGRFPSAIRDISILVDADVPASRVLETIVGRPLVASAALFDVYTGQNLPTGKRSLAYHIYFQAPDRTLTAEEVGGALRSVVDALAREVGADLRE
jgi:phenylalanyl-tRNA synthetase beta chain